MLRIAIVMMIALAASTARADLMADVDALTKAWRGERSSANRVTTVFLHEGEKRRVPFADSRTTSRPCMALVAIAERHVRFAMQSGLHDEPVESRAGVARIVDCGGGALSGPKHERKVTLVITRGRGAIELIRATYATQLRPVDVVLPERALGPVGTDAASPGALALAPHGKRVARARRSAQLEGARTVQPFTLSASEEGTGNIVVELESGCHRIHVMADARLADVDAEALRDDGTTLRRDRSHAPDARLQFCLGTSEKISIRFVGAPPSSPMTLLDARWPVPAGVPTGWGPEARAGLAWALFRRRAPRPEKPPEFQSLGAAGATVLPIAVEPGRCYLAAFSLARGTASAGRLAGQVGNRQAYDDASDVHRSAAVTFCAGPADDLVRLVVDVRSRDAWWVAAVWRLGGDG